MLSMLFQYCFSVIYKKEIQIKPAWLLPMVDPSNLGLPRYNIFYYIANCFWKAVTVLLILTLDEYEFEETGSL